MVTAQVAMTATAVVPPKSLTMGMPVAIRPANPRAVVREVKKQARASSVKASTTAGTGASPPRHRLRAPTIRWMASAIPTTRTTMGVLLVRTVTDRPTKPIPPRVRRTAGTTPARIRRASPTRRK